MQVYLDTNVLLHFRLPKEIDWCRLLDASDVTLVVLPVVLRELDRHKNQHPRRKLRERARGAVKWLSEVFESEQRSRIRSNVVLRYEAAEPVVDFSGLNLSRDVPDDWIIAGIVGGGSESAVLVTADLGLKMKARAHGIQVVELPDDIKLPDELDDDTRQIRELQREVERLRNATPSLALSNSGGEDFLSAVIHPPLEMPPLEELLAGVRKKYAPIQEHDGKPASHSSSNPVAQIQRTMQQAMGPMFSIRPEDVRAYNEELPRFFEEHGEYLARKHQYGNMMRRSFRVDLLLSNNGTAPAEDVDLELHFPDGMRIVESGGLPREPQPPDPPSRPMTMAQQLSQSHDVFPASLASTFRTPDLLVPDVHRSGPIIKKTNSYTVEYSFRSIKHHCPEVLEPLHGIFDSFDCAGSFTVDYRITAANIPDLLQGSLNVRVEKAPSEDQ
jgi:rRNA-processing protein FCF1